MALHITTNNHLRPIVDAWELPADVRSQFDYLDWEALEDGSDSGSFVQYQGEWIDLNDIQRTEIGGDFHKQGWDGLISDSYWSGRVFRIVLDYCGEHSVIIGSFYFTDCTN